MNEKEAQGDAFLQQAIKAESGWSLFGGSKYEKIEGLLENAFTCFRVAKAWDKAGDTGKRLAENKRKTDGEAAAASAFVDAASAYKKSSPTKAIQCLETAVELYIRSNRLSMAARHSKEVAELYEAQGQGSEKEAMAWFEKASDYYASEGNASTSVNQCNLKLAEIAARLGEYERAIKLYEDVATASLDSNLLKYSAKGYFLNAGICHLNLEDESSIAGALVRYQDLDPSFEGSREHKLLEALAEAKSQGDTEAFTEACSEFDSLSRLDHWKTTLLLRAKKSMDAEPDLT